ncbi:Peroxidase [Quillaja saponaria]|uniref:Peroxidase n=1 Tax=Quillaja saponaria TaxID=32244 RepID=A0AAD7LUH3_QUISA|nr:Peroxidase [Quillaja saponaria]
MASVKSFFIVSLLIAVSSILNPASAHLSSDFYKKICPKALPEIKKVVQRAIRNETRIGASLLRLHFHDCFVNGCDGSVLLDDTANFTGEKTSLANNNSARGFNVIDDIKSAVNRVCKGNVVSCADIVAVAARDSVAILGGLDYPVLLGRRDARTASRDAANNNLPAPFFNFSQLLSNFQAHGLNLKDLVALSGSHTLGFAKCATFRNRINNDTNIDPKFAASLRAGVCPASGGDNNLQPLDATSGRFDSVYYQALLKKKGLLHSDQELFKGNRSQSDRLVQRYSRNRLAFDIDFAHSIIKMGNIKPLTGNNGEIRLNCRKIN